MKRQARVITVFGSSRPRFGDAQYAEAHALGMALATKGFVVCSGGYAGVMEAVSRGAKQAGGRTIGITAKSFSSRANEWIDKEVRVANWQDRLFELVKRGHGYVACRGGTGTLAELAVVWEMLNKGVMKARPLVAMGEFWEPVIKRVHDCDAEIPLSESGRAGEPCVRFAPSAAEAADYIASRLKK